MFLQAYPDDVSPIWHNICCCRHILMMLALFDTTFVMCVSIAYSLPTIFQPWKVKYKNINFLAFKLFQILVKPYFLHIVQYNPAQSLIPIGWPIWGWQIKASDSYLLTYSIEALHFYWLVYWSLRFLLAGILKPRIPICWHIEALDAYWLAYLEP